MGQILFVFNKTIYKKIIYLPNIYLFKLLNLTLTKLFHTTKALYFFNW